MSLYIEALETENRFLKFGCIQSILNKCVPESVRKLGKCWFCWVKSKKSEALRGLRV